MSALLEKDKVEEKLTVDSNDGDHDRFAHYFKNKDVEAAIFTGKPAKALCGKLSIPMGGIQGRITCPECAEIYGKLRG